jgi:hypothetical protein
MGGKKEVEDFSSTGTYKIETMLGEDDDRT